MMSRNDDDDDENWFLEVFHPSQQQQQPSPYNNIPHKPLTANDGENRNHESSTTTTITKTTTENALLVSTTDVYVVTLQNPKECATFIKHLSKVLPLSSSLSHLKRVKRVQQKHVDVVSSITSVVATTASAEVKVPSVDDDSNADAVATATNRQKKRQHVTTVTTCDGKNDVPQSRIGRTSKRPNTTTTTHKNESISLKVLLGTKIEIEQRFGPSSLWLNHTEATILPSSSTAAESKQSQYDDDDISILFTSCPYPHIVRATMEMVPVPRGMPRSEREWKHGNDTIWPTTYLPNQMEEYRIAQTILQHQLSSMERRQMKCGIQAAIQDASNFQQHSHHDSGGAPSARWFRSSGVVIVHPHTGQILTSAHEEYTFQQQQQQQRNLHNCVVPPNPLMTPYIYAIQGISRIERQNMTAAITSINHGASNVQSYHDDNNITLDVPTNLDSNRGTHSTEEAPLILPLPLPLPQPQYLCTGYDVYATMEPNIYEAMALVHSRIRRLVFGCSMSDVEALANINSDQTRMNSHFGRHDSGILDTYVHALPSTNHHYRAFMCRPNSALWHRCCPYHNQHERSDKKS